MNSTLASSGKSGHVGDRVADRLRVHARFVFHRAVGLHHAGAGDHAIRHRRRSVADVDLADRDIVLAAVEVGGLGETGDRMLGRGIGRGVRARRVRRDRAVVDDAAAARVLVLHDAEGVLGAQERAGEVGVHHRLPLLEAEVLEIDRRRAHAGVVEQHVQPAVAVHRLGEQGGDRAGVGHVGGNAQALADIVAELLGLFQHLHATPGEHHGEACIHQRQRCRASDAGAGTGDDRDLVCCVGHLFPRLQFFASVWVL